jgi:CDP-diacylglycerol--serine O-phosphatidyltransferase
VRIERRGRAEGRRRGIALLPSLFTTGNLFLGFWAIVKALHGQFGDAAPLLFWAIILDMLDGRIARLTGTTSEFGGELDSLADAISFGVAPALLAYLWGFSSLPRLGWIAAFVFLMCGVFRLARFNVQRHSVDGRYFVGLPIPMAAAQIATLVHFDPEPITFKAQAVMMVALVLTLALLMVSTMRYHSFKGLDLRKRRSYITVVGFLMLLLPVVAFPEYALLILASAYAVSGPTNHLWAILRRRGAAPPGALAAGEAR